MTEATVHTRVPAAQQARWVGESRAAGQRLGDWITARVDRHPDLIETPEDLSAWIERMGYTRQQAADALGVGRDIVQRWLAASTPIERRTALACAALDLGVGREVRAVDVSDPTPE